MTLIKLVEADSAGAEVQALFQKIENIFGEVTDNFRLAGVSPDVLGDLLRRGATLVTECGFSPDSLAAIRYMVAYKEEGTFCINFNTKLLAKSGYTDEDLAKLRIGGRPERMKVAEHALVIIAAKAVLHPLEFSSGDVEYLKGFGYSEKQIFDAVEHAGNMVKIVRILKAFKIS